MCVKLCVGVGACVCVCEIVLFQTTASFMAESKPNLLNYSNVKSDIIFEVPLK